MLRPSIKDCLSKHMICVQNTKKTTPSQGRNIKKKNFKNIERVPCRLKRSPSRFYFHIRGQAAGHPKQPRQQQMTIFTGQFARPSSYDSVTCCGFSYGEISN